MLLPITFSRTLGVRYDPSSSVVPSGPTAVKVTESVAGTMPWLASIPTVTVVPSTGCTSDCCSVDVSVTSSDSVVGSAGCTSESTVGSSSSSGSCCDSGSAVGSGSTLGSMSSPVGSLVGSSRSVEAPSPGSTSEDPCSSPVSSLRSASVAATVESCSSAMARRAVDGIDENASAADSSMHSARWPIVA